jgi:PAS domain S-box-containing protein
MRGSRSSTKSGEHLSAHALALAELNHEALFLVAAADGRILDANPTAGRRLGKARDEIVGRPIAELLAFPDLDRILHTRAAGRPVRWSQRLALAGEQPARLWDVQLMPLAASESSDVLVTLRAESEYEGAYVPRLQVSLGSLVESLRTPESDDPAAAFAQACAALVPCDACGLYLPTADGPVLRLAHSRAEARLLPASISASEFASPQSRLVWKLGQPTTSELARWAGSNGVRDLTAIAFPPGEHAAAALVFTWSEADPPHDAALLLTLAALGGEAWIRARTRTSELSGMRTTLARVQSMNESLIEELPHAILLIQTASGGVLAANPGAEEMLEYSESELRAAKLDEWLTAPEAVVAVRAAGESGRIQEVNELTLYRRSGESFPAFLRAIPIRSDPARAPDETLVILSDITSSQAARVEAQHLQRQAVLGWLAAAFAHEVRNPLNNLTLQLGEMGALHSLTPELADLVKEAQNECRRLSDISKRMLDFARGQDFRLVPTDMVALVNRILQRMRPTLERAGVQSHLTAAEGLPQAMADPLSIEQVIINLIDNAAKAMPQGGHLAVTIEPRALPSGNPGVEVRVADTGQGLPSTVRDKLFQPYVTTRTEGHGLGLALSRHILDAHRGTLIAETYPGSGTVFRICIPVAGEDQA